MAEKFKEGVSKETRSEMGLKEGDTYFKKPLFMSDTIFPKACSNGFSEPF